MSTCRPARVQAGPPERAPSPVACAVLPVSAWPVLRGSTMAYGGLLDHG